MKPKLAREIALLSLPVLFLGGIAWWKGAGGQEKTSSWWRQANGSEIKIVKTFVWMQAPYDSAENAGENDTRIAIWTSEHVPMWLRGEKYVPMMRGLSHTAGTLPGIGRAGGNHIMPALSYSRGGEMHRMNLPGIEAPSFKSVSACCGLLKARAKYLLKEFLAPKTCHRLRFAWWLVRPGWYGRQRS